MNIILTVQEDHKIEVVRDLLCEAMRKSRNEPGCERFDVYQSQSNPTIYDDRTLVFKGSRCSSTG